MSKRTDKEYLLDISEAIKRIELYVENLDYQNFLKDIKTQDAVLRNIEIIAPRTPHIVYVNGQSVLTPKLGETQVEIRHIEPEFKRLMEG